MAAASEDDVDDAEATTTTRIILLDNDGDAEASALRQMIDAIARQATALPPPILLACNAVARWAAANGHDATRLAADVIICCWLAPAIAAPHAFGIGLLSATDEQAHRLAALSGRLRSLTSSVQPAIKNASSSDNALIVKLQKLSTAVLSAAGGLHGLQLSMPIWDSEVMCTAALTASQLAALLRLLRSSSVSKLNAAISMVTAADDDEAAQLLVIQPRLLAMLGHLISAVDFDALLGAAAQPPADDSPDSSHAIVAVDDGSLSSSGVLNQLPESALLKIPLVSDDDHADEYSRIAKGQQQQQSSAAEASSHLLLLRLWTMVIRLAKRLFRCFATY